MSYAFAFNTWGFAKHDIVVSSDNFILYNIKYYESRYIEMFNEIPTLISQDENANVTKQSTC